MIFTDLELNGLKLIKHTVYNDNRGYFFECFHKERFLEAGIPDEFYQDNISRSLKGTIRGLHYQVGKYAQGKLCQVLHGKVLDVVVDIRFESPTYGKHFAVELSAENATMLWIPPGFAHGFSVLSEDAVFYYKCTERYSKPDERALLYSDSTLGIDWKVVTPLVSDKDNEGTPFAQIEKDFIWQNNTDTDKDC